MALKNKQLILAKIESTYGANANPTNGLNAIQTGDVTITPLAGDMVSRNIVRPYFGNNQNIMVTKYVTIDFEVELGGSGTLGFAPQFGTLLKAC